MKQTETAKSRVWREVDFSSLREADPPQAELENSMICGAVRRWTWADGRTRSWRGYGGDQWAEATELAR